MSLLFKGAELRPILAEAIANQCHIILVKDHGVYFIPERGERLPNGSYRRIAYAIGLNPDVDPFDSWWEAARTEFGGDDFGEHLNPKLDVFTRILHTEDDLVVSATPTQLLLQAVSSSPGSN